MNAMINSWNLICDSVSKGNQSYSNNNTWSEAFDRLAQGIALDTAAQEGAQNPALRLWNASVGLNQSATGVLVAMSGQGTKTTTTKESGGDFFSGLLSAATTAFTGGIGSGLGSALFK